jgi:hypothetical protein
LSIVRPLKMICSKAAGSLGAEAYDI